MAGGKYDSSRTRVAPFFDALFGRDKTGQSWLARLVSLPEHGSDASRPTRSEPLIEARWGPKERPLSPPVSLLSWLIRNVQDPDGKVDADIGPQRRDLLARDPARIEEAIRLLRTEPSVRGWHILEGPSYPDVFLATADVVVAIEGKRTESGPTTSTTWMPVRHQMLRHLDAALEIAGRRSVFGFFIVEGAADGSLPAEWLATCQQTLETSVLEQSLPHRPATERRLIAQAFLGATTWQRACDSLGVPFSSLAASAAS
jgi:hypothetical protein